MTTTHKLKARTWWLALLGLAGVSMLAGACDRAHMSPYYGRSYAAWFGMQHAPAAAESDSAKRALSSLDSQEAAAISKNYRHNTGGDVAQGQGQMVLLGQAHNGGAEGYIPPPSVPGGQ